MSSFSIFFLLYLSLHACTARRLGFFADEIGNRVGFLAGKDANKLKSHKIEMESSISKKLQTGVQKVNLSPFLQAKEISGGCLSAVQVKGLKRARGRLMLGNSDAGAEEALDSKEKDSVGDIDVMDYAQPHRKPPIHNENIND
ncbi:hypothetical protein V6N12_068670 [Hibiscus sabdariffa]|uniref:Uncharacterized protein n=1 Tax=Hibiscus sabdariffa TaxID=183260 RepID=A0ABR2FQP3_9ROSI